MLRSVAAFDLSKGDDMTLSAALDPADPPTGAPTPDRAGSPRRPGSPDGPGDRKLDRRFADFRATGDRKIRNALVEDHRWLALHCVNRFVRKGEPTDDLVQVAMLGLVKAIDRFDPARGFAFTTFAVPTILGELRRHFRDHTWAVRVHRAAKENYIAVRDARDTLTQVLGRSPTMVELADHCGLSVEEAIEAHDLGFAYRGDSLEHSEVESEQIPQLGVDEPGYAASEARLAMPKLLALLPGDRERSIIELRFVREMTQSQIADTLGLSQVHVSRLLRSSLDLLRHHLNA